jgi:hypothetical protein
VASWLPRIAPGSSGLFGIYAAVGYDVMSATNSSPQTTELFAGDRAETLWKYVKLGDVQVCGLALFGALVAQQEEPGSWVWPVLGATATMLAMHAMYAHALAAGQAKAGRGGVLAGALWGRG